MGSLSIPKWELPHIDMFTFASSIHIILKYRFSDAALACAFTVLRDPIYRLNVSRCLYGVCLETSARVCFAAKAIIIYACFTYLALECFYLMLLFLFDS